MLPEYIRHPKKCTARIRQGGTAALLLASLALGSGTKMGKYCKMKRET